MLLFVQLERFDSKVRDGMMESDAATADKIGQFQGRPAIGVGLNAGGIVVAKMHP
jgi:hypothetical protein